MSTFAFLLVCIQACLLQQVYSQAVGYNLPYGHSHGALGVSDVDFTAVNVEARGLGAAGYNGGLGYGWGGPNVGLAGGLGFGAANIGGLGAVGLGAANMGGIGFGAAGVAPAALPGGYGGTGNGLMTVAGELPVAGTTVVTGAIPMLGAVSFGGNLPAAGSVSIAGNCGCGGVNYGVY